MKTGLIAIKLRQRIAAAWQGLTPRERRLLILGGAALAVMLCWWWVMEPAVKTRKTMQQQLPALRVQSTQLRVLAQELTDLPPAAPLGPAVSRQELERLLMDSGLKAQQITLTENTVTLSFSDVPFSALTEYLQKAQREQQWIVTDATMTARDRIDRVDAKLSLQRHS